MGKRVRTGGSEQERTLGAKSDHGVACNGVDPETMQKIPDVLAPERGVVLGNPGIGQGNDDQRIRGQEGEFGNNGPGGERGPDGQVVRLPGFVDLPQCGLHRTGRVAVYVRAAQAQFDRFDDACPKFFGGEGRYVEISLHFVLAEHGIVHHARQYARRPVGRGPFRSAQGREGFDGVDRFAPGGAKQVSAHVSGIVAGAQQGAHADACEQGGKCSLHAGAVLA